MHVINTLLLEKVYAQDFTSYSEIVDIVDYIAKGLNVLIFASAAVFILYVIYGAYKFASAQGDPKAIEGGKQTLTQAVIGLCIILGVFSINLIIANILGINDPNYTRASGPFDALRGALNSIVAWVDSSGPQFYEPGEGDPTPPEGDPDQTAYEDCVADCAPSDADCLAACWDEYMADDDEPTCVDLCAEKYLIGSSQYWSCVSDCSEGEDDPVDECGFDSLDACITHYENIWIECTDDCGYDQECTSLCDAEYYGRFDECVANCDP